MSIKNLEIEFKYPAETVRLQDFKDFCESRSPLNFLLISGWDHFLSNPKDKDSFYRHRINTNENQLTFKRKTNKDNSYIREERNIDLPMSVTEDKIKDLCSVHGYFYDTSLFKNCFIYNYEYYTLVYYICYDLDMKELGRFIEIEMKEDYKWDNQKEAWESLVSLEKLCKKIGASDKNRFSISLYEMFSKTRFIERKQ